MFTVTLWGPVMTPQGLSNGPIGSVRVSRDEDALILFDEFIEHGNTCMITDEDGFFVDPRDLGYLVRNVDQSC